MARTSSIYDHFITWPPSVTLTFNLPQPIFQMALLLLKENNCTKLFWNPCINVEVMAQTSSIYDHSIIWPSSVTLAFNLTEQIFWMAFLLVKENNCAKLCWYLCINIEVMAWKNPDRCMHTKRKHIPRFPFDSKSAAPDSIFELVFQLFGKI